MVFPAKDGEIYGRTYVSAHYQGRTYHGSRKHLIYDLELLRILDCRNLNNNEPGSTKFGRERELNIWWPKEGALDVIGVVLVLYRMYH